MNPPLQHSRKQVSLQLLTLNSQVASNRDHLRAVTVLLEDPCSHPINQMADNNIQNTSTKDLKHHSGISGYCMYITKHTYAGNENEIIL